MTTAAAITNRDLDVNANRLYLTMLLVAGRPELRAVGF
jgi:hypothetical protein